MNPRRARARSREPRLGAEVDTAFTRPSAGAAAAGSPPTPTSDRQREEGDAGDGPFGPVDLDRAVVDRQREHLDAPPPRSCGVTNADRASVKQITPPEATPGSVSGSVTRQKVAHGPAPRSRAASLSEVSSFPSTL